MGTERQLVRRTEIIETVTLPFCVIFLILSANESGDQGLLQFDKGVNGSVKGKGRSSTDGNGSSKDVVSGYVICSD